MIPLKCNRFKVVADGDIQLSVQRGRRTGTFYGNPTYIWHGSVYSKTKGRLWVGKVEKKISFNNLLKKAGAV
jgi:hypothetical protein